MKSIRCRQCRRYLPLFVFIFLPAIAALGQESASQRWESAIRNFEQGDRTSPPPKDGVLFIGSSSIRRWDLERSFPGRGYINRGFGGSQIADAIYFADRIVVPYQPRMIVLYAGDNDIAKGKSAEQVAKDFTAFVNKARGELPQTEIAFLAIKPSLARWNLVDKMRDANRRIEAFAAQDKQIHFVDIDKPMLSGDGKPREELFVEDGLHLSDAGYDLWAKTLAPFLKD